MVSGRSFHWALTMALSKSRATPLLLNWKPVLVSLSHMTTLVLSKSRCHPLTLTKSVACAETITTSEKMTSESQMEQMPMMLQVWLRAGGLGKALPPVIPFWYHISVTRWRRQSMPVSCTVGASSPAPGPLLAAYQFWGQRATSGPVWSACALPTVTQRHFVRHSRFTPISARRLESPYPHWGTLHSAVCFFNDPLMGHLLTHWWKITK